MPKLKKISDLKKSWTPEQHRLCKARTTITALYGISPFRRHSFVKDVIREMGTDAFTLEALERIADRQNEYEIALFAAYDKSKKGKKDI